MVEGFNLTLLIIIFLIIFILDHYQGFCYKQVSGVTYDFLS